METPCKLRPGCRITSLTQSFSLLLPVALSRGLPTRWWSPHLVQQRMFVSDITDPRLHLPCWQSLAKFFFLWGLHQEICCRPPYISSNSLHPIKKILLRFCNQCLPKITFLLREGLKNMLSDFLSLLRACSNLLIPCFSDNWFVMFTFPVIVNP